MRIEATQPDTAVQTAKTAKLADAAQEFEASMLQELLKPMQNGQNSWGGQDSDQDNGQDQSFDTIRSFGTEAVAKAISKGGGFGIAKQIISKINVEHQRTSHKENPKV
jgi:flagellar protein FlgJ